MKISEKIRKVEKIRKLALEGCREYFERRFDPLFEKEYRTFSAVVHECNAKLSTLDDELFISKL